MEKLDFRKHYETAYPRKDVRCEWYHYKSVKDLQFFLNRGRVLDLGCGEGHLTTLIPERYQRYALDISLANLRLIKKRDNKIEVICGDGQNLPFQSKTFDAIISIQVVEHLPNDKKMLKEAARILCKEGILVISTTIKGLLNLGRKLSPDHLHEYRSMEELVEMCEGTDKTSLKLLEVKKRAVRVSIKEILAHLGLKNKSKNLSMSVPLLFHSYDGYVVFKKVES